jgi:uncharacterized protein
MTFSLYEATIPGFLQGLAALGSVLDIAEAHCTEKGLAPADLIQARLIEDMFPFAYQITSSAHHSLGAIAGVRQGVFSPDLTPPPESFAALRQKITTAHTTLASIDRSEVNGFIGQDMRFEFGQRRMEFTAENFLLSFSMPNFYFHATTAYDILRMKGLPLTKKIYLGVPRLKGV